MTESRAEAADEPVGPAEPRPRLSVGRGVRMLWQRPWFWLPVAPVVALDLWSKWAVFALLQEKWPNRSEYVRELEVWERGSPVDFQLVSWRNPGTIWGLGQNLTELLIVLRIVALGLIVYFALRLPARARLHLLVLGLILAGAIGNLYDNLTQTQGGVRDFLKFSTMIGGDRYTFPAFNVADSCICVGAITLAVLLWRGQPEAPHDPGP